MRNRRRSRGGQYSRRTLLSSGLITVGSALLLADTGAFSQIAATRMASVGVHSDDDALLGLDAVDVAAVGVDTDLVSLTNNTTNEITATIDLTNSRTGESLDPVQTTLFQNESKQFTASLDVGRATDDESVDIDIVGSGPEIDIEIARTIVVPSFSWLLFDNSENGNVQFDLQYTIANIPNLGSIDIHVVNIDSGVSESHTRTTTGGTITYPEEGRDWNAGGDEYEITFDAFDEEVGQILHKVVTITGGENAGEGDPGSEDDPQLEWVFVDDMSHDWDGVEYTVYYQVSNLENFGEVEITFYHENDWATGSATTTQNPVGMVEHDSGNYEDDFDIVVRVENDSGATVDTETRSDTANGENPSNSDISELDSPTFATLDIRDDSDDDRAEYTVTYTIDNDDRFGEVRAQFENLSGNDETNETITDSSGTFTYSAGYTGGEEYRITIRIFENRHDVLVPVETEIVTDIADAADP